MNHTSVRGRCYQGGLILALLLFLAAPAAAFQFTLGDVQASLDTTLSYGLNWRVAERDKDIIGDDNGGRAYSVNGDDGNLNYDDNDYFSKVFKITSDLEMKYQNYGLFLRGTAFYDFVNANGDGGERTEITDSDALDLVGKDAKLLDAFIWWDFELGGMPGTLKVGDQVLSWGESTFIQNSINTINPVDVSKLRMPGSELKEALVPVGMVSASLAINDKLSIDGFYQYDWEKTRIDPVGSYWSTTDIVGDGGDKVVLGWGSVPDQGTCLASVGSTCLLFDPNFLMFSRGGDDTPDDGGQYGVAIHLLAPGLNNTDFGFYFVNYHSRLPIISAKTGNGAVADATYSALVGSVGPTRAAAAALNAYAQTGSYYVEYPENIQMFGASFNTQLTWGGLALQGEVSYRKDMPLQVDDVELLLAALSPIGFNPAYDYNQLGVFGNNQTIHGYEEFDVSQAQLTATKLVSNVLGADLLSLVGELGVTYIHDFPDKDKLRLESAGTYVSGNPFHTTPPFPSPGFNPAIPFGGAHANLPAEPSGAFADQTSWGYRLVGRLDYNNAIGAVTLSPRIAWAHDVDGNSPNPGGNFLEHRKAITVGLEASYLNSWSADLSYTDFFGAGRYNLINDRDFVSFNVKYSF